MDVDRLGRGPTPAATNCFRCTAATPRPSGPRPTAAGPTPAASTSSSPTSATTRASAPTCGPTTVRGSEPDAFADRFPWATCELGGGMAVAYHRRPRVDAADIGALGLTKIGCGSVWQGYYMFHGGTNPPGELTHPPGVARHRLPQRPARPDATTSRPRSASTASTGRSYHELRLQHLLLADFGHLIAPMESALPERRPTGSTTGTPCAGRCAATATSGFLFVTNHQPHEPLPDHPDTVVHGRLPVAPVTLDPAQRPVTVPTRRVLLLAAAAGRGRVCGWSGPPPSPCARSRRRRPYGPGAGRDGRHRARTRPGRGHGDVRRHARPATSRPVGDRLLVTGLRPGTDALVEVDTADGERVGLLVLDAATARTAYRGEAWGAERLVLCGDGVVFDRDEVRLHGSGAGDVVRRAARTRSGRPWWTG